MDGAESNSLTNQDNFCLKWSNYQSHVLGVLVQLLEAESMVDVTLCTSNGDKFFAHKIVLCAASSYFQEIFSDNDDYHLVVILCEVEPNVLRSILEFVYHGELNVHASQLTEVLQAAASLQIRGLTEVSDQLPLLVHSDFEVSPVAQFEESDNTKPNHKLPELVETVREEAVEAPYCDVDAQSMSFPNAEFENPLHHQKVQEEDSEGNCTDKSERRINSQIQTFAESSSGFCNIHSESWSVGSYETTGTQKHKKRKRRESCRKEYSEDQLAAALKDLKKGQLLRETSSAHKIPRSTLYVRAKAEGIPITVSRQEHSGENVNAAVQAVNKGASLQQASEMYQIPKTVLWRRVKASGSNVVRVPPKSYGPIHLQAAVEALQNGQNLSRVSTQFQIPKTTLFREKARLIEAGKLPWTSLKKRESQSHSMKHSRLKEAIAACKEGKMSQAVASITYQIPKTTIWRKLRTQQNSKLNMETERSAETTDARIEETEGSEAGTIQEQTQTGALQEQSQFTFIEGNSQLPVAYIVEEDFSSTALII